MVSGRVVLVVTGVVVAGLAGVFAVTQWDRASRLATVVSALAGVAAVGVAMWAALPGRGSTVTVSRTGDAVSGRGGSANTGLMGPVDGSGRVEVEGTGRADASDGGIANTGVDL